MKHLLAVLLLVSSSAEAKIHFGPGPKADKENVTKEESQFGSSPQGQEEDLDGDIHFGPGPDDLDGDIHFGPGPS